MTEVNNSLTDGERLVRIETLVENLVGVVSAHTVALKDHIATEEKELREIHETIKPVPLLTTDVEGLKKDVKDLNTMKNRALGWVAALIFAAGILWELVIHPLTFIKDKS